MSRNRHKSVPGVLISLFSRLGIEHALELLQVNLRVGIPGFRVGIVPSRGRERGLVASIGSSWPNDISNKDLPFALMYSIAVTIVRLTPAPL